MKKTIYSLAFLICAFLISSHVHGQQSVEVRTDSTVMSIGRQPVFVVNIPESDADQVKKNWIKRIRQNTKSKVQEKGGEINIEATLITGICENPINVYSLLLPRDSVLILYAAFEIDSAFFSLRSDNKTIRNEKINNSIRGFLREFAVEQYRLSVGRQLELEQEKLAGYKEELEEMTDQVEKYNKEITSNEQKIINSEDAIESYKSDNERKITEINNKKSALAVIDDPELKKQGKSQLKGLEKEKRNIEKDLEEAKKDIVGYQSEIKRYQEEIANIQKRMEEKKAVITSQESTVRSVTTRMAGIR